MPEYDPGGRGTSAPAPTRAVSSAAKPPAKKTTARKPAAKKTAVPKGSFNVDSFMAALRQHESGSNYTSRSGSSSASGAYQYLDSTWNNYGGYAHAWQAPQSVQDQRARADVQASLKRYDGDWRKVAAAHFAGSGWVHAHPDPSTWNVNPVPGSNNPTVSQYVSSVFHLAGTAPFGVGGAGGTPATATTGDITAQATQKFGYLAAFMSDPEIGPILTKATQQGWDQPTLEGALFKTTFWQRHSATTRQWDANQRLDPASNKQAVDQTYADLMQVANSSGLVIDPNRLRQIATDANRFGWDSIQQKNALKAEGHYDTSGKTLGSALTTADSLKRMAGDYYINLSPGAVNEWVGKIQNGDITQEDYRSFLVEQAKSLFPSLAGALDRGITVATYADPYKQAAASTLERDPESIDLMKNPTFQKALFNIDPKTKERTPMSLSDWDVYLRKLPEFGQTHQANQAAAAMGNSILAEFGKVAG